MVTSKLFRRHITWHVARSGLTDAQVAARAGITRSHFNRIKNGRAIPRIDTALAIARALDVKVVDLYREARH